LRFLARAAAIFDRSTVWIIEQRNPPASCSIATVRSNAIRGLRSAP
jgi:hypothetical protein